MNNKRIEQIKNSDAVKLKWAFEIDNYDGYIITGPNLKHGHRYYSNEQPPKPYRVVIGGEEHEGIVEPDDDISEMLFQAIADIKYLLKQLPKEKS